MSRNVVHTPLPKLSDREALVGAMPRPGSQSRDQGFEAQSEEEDEISSIPNEEAPKILEPRRPKSLITPSRHIRFGNDIRSQIQNEMAKLQEQF